MVRVLYPHPVLGGPMKEGLEVIFKSIRWAIALAGLAVIPFSSDAQQPNYLYRTELIQAAPGKLVEVIDLYKKKAVLDQQAGDEPALSMRHSQGDRWDLLRLIPM